MSIICTKKVENVNVSCRVCLKSFGSYFEFGTPLDLQNLDGPTFQTAISAVTNMDCFVANANTVYLICSLCAEELKTAFRFLQKAKNTETILRPPDPIATTIKMEKESLKIELEDNLFSDNLLILSSKDEFEDAFLDPSTIEHEEVVALDLKDTSLYSESLNDSFQELIEESSFSLEEEETSFDSLGPQLHCSPCNKTFENQESMNEHQTWHLTNDLGTSGVVNEVVINPPSDCEDETNSNGECFFVVNLRY